MPPSISPSPLVPSDLYLLRLANEPRIAPGGSVYFVLATQHEASDRTLTAIWRVAAGASAERFTSGETDRLPRVSPDGTTLAFTGERGDGKRIFTIPLGGGEARAISESYEAITALAWSPDSTRLAYCAKTPLDAATASIALDERSGARHIRALPFKSDDDGLLDGRRNHLFIVGVAGGPATQVTHGDFDVNGPAWSPTGDRLAVTAKIDRPEASFSEDLFTIDVGTADGQDRAPGIPRKLTQSRGPAMAPAFSNDGKEIAFLGHEEGDDLGSLSPIELLVIGANGGATRSLSAVTDRPAADLISGDTRPTGGQSPPVWAADDGEIFAQISDRGSCGIRAFARDGSSSRPVVAGDRDVFAFTCGADGALAFAFSAPTLPAEIALLDRAAGERILTANNPWLAERTLREPHRVRPIASDGTELDLWLLDPRPDDRSEPALDPYVLEVHGGPHMAYGYTFMFEFQMLASHGIGVAYGNPRGSQTYGRAYTTAIVGDWGGVDASDVLTLLDGALANAPIDPARVGLAGGSYGGFMTTWLLGHCDRFAAGVSMRAVNDFVSEVGASDAGWFLEKELDAPWADGGRKLFERSPLRAAHAIEAPLLVEHSERDFRCPIDQGEQLFTLLRRLGRTDVEFVRFTGDGHGLSRSGKPRNRVLRLRAIAHWLIRHLRPAGVAAQADYAGALFAPLETEEVKG
jgi:dipeptidyl aminopeptidase/acylaminoacyl peptidase